MYPLSLLICRSHTLCAFLMPARFRVDEKRDELPVPRLRMDSERFIRGKKKLAEMSGDEVETMIDNLHEIAPDLARYTIEFPYGEILVRPGLDIRSRQIATVAALTALGNAPVQLKAHISMALNVGVTREEVTEIITQMAVYAGFPAALNGMAAAKEVFREREEKMI
jgi:4-carboxymuconolactone decarboxylase